MVRHISGEVLKLFGISGANGYLAYFNLTDVSVAPIINNLDLIRASLGIVATIIAIVYGYYQIRLIKKKLKKNDS